jgi:hypothetical protein
VEVSLDFFPHCQRPLRGRFPSLSADHPDRNAEKRNGIMIRFACPKCHEMNEHSNQEAGQVVACTSCQKKLRVPALKKGKSAPARSDPEEAPLEKTTGVSELVPPRKAKKEAPARLRDSEEEQEEESERPPKKRLKPSAVLGRRKATFEPRRELLKVLVVVFIITGAGGLLCFILALAGPLADGGIALAMFMLPTGIGGAWWCLSMLTLKVVLHEGGLAHTHYGKERLIPWDEIRTVKQDINEIYRDGVYQTTTYLYTLELNDGTRIKYSNYRLQKVEKLGSAIMDQTSQVIFPRAMKQFEKGKVVDFGPLGVSRDGLHYGSSLLEWEDVEGVKIHEGYITMRKRGKWLRWCNIAASSIPNLLVFLSLVNQTVGVDDD